MKRRYDSLEEAHRIPMRALKFLHTAGVYSFTVARLGCVLDHVWKVDLLMPGSLDSILGQLESRGFIGVTGSSVRVYSVYLEDVVTDYF